MQRQLQHERPGLAGQASSPTSPDQAYLLQNMVLDPDGTFRPRMGTKLWDTFSDPITWLAGHPGGNALMLVEGGDLRWWAGPTPTVENDVMDAGGWPSDPIKSCYAPPATTTPRALLHKASIGGSAGALYQVTGTYPLTAATVGGAPTGNYVDMHGYIAMSLNGQKIRWSAYGDPATWDSLNEKAVIPEIGNFEAIIPMSNEESIIFGARGIARVTGRSGLPNDMRFQPLQNFGVALPAHTIVKTRNEIIFLAPGPRIMSYAYGQLRRLDRDINRDLRALPGMTNLRVWYDELQNWYVIADLTSTKAYIFGLDEQRWLGCMVHAGGSVPMLGSAFFPGALTGNAQPWAYEYMAHDDKLIRWDPTLYTDETSPASFTPFVCAVESIPEDAGAREVKKQMIGVFVDGVGSFTVTLQHRNGADESYTSTVLGTVTAPGWVYSDPDNDGSVGASTRPTYRERKVRVHADSSSTLRFKGMRFKERSVGRDR